jgi:hypothetical protein
MWWCDDMLRRHFNTLIHHSLQTLNLGLSLDDFTHSLLDDTCNLRLWVLFSDRRVLLLT